MRGRNEVLLSRVCASSGIEMGGFELIRHKTEEPINTGVSAAGVQSKCSLRVCDGAIVC